IILFFFFFSSRRRHTRLQGDWSSDVCSSDLWAPNLGQGRPGRYWWVPGPPFLPESAVEGERRGSQPQGGFQLSTGTLLEGYGSDWDKTAVASRAERFSRFSQDEAIGGLNF